jgi:hypothetical protein
MTRQTTHLKTALRILMTAGLLAGACNDRNAGGQDQQAETGTPTDSGKAAAGQKREPIGQPLVSDIYTADPSAHVFNGRVYIYPSHDIEAGVPQDDNGSHFAMRDYHVLSLDSIGGKVTDHGVALDIKDIPWAGRQLWAPDAAFANNRYYLYFPVKDKKDVFRIGVATSPSPTGPFKAEREPIKGSYSIDPAAFGDKDGNFYLYFGGIWGGQLQRWQTGKYDSTAAPEPERQRPGHRSAGGPAGQEHAGLCRAGAGNPRSSIPRANPSRPRPQPALLRGRLDAQATTASTTFRTPPAIRTSLPTPPATARTGPLPTGAWCSTPWRAGPTTTPSWSSKATGIVLPRHATLRPDPPAQREGHPNSRTAPTAPSRR